MYDHVARTTTVGVEGSALFPGRWKAASTTKVLIRRAVYSVLAPAWFGSCWLMMARSSRQLVIACRPLPPRPASERTRADGNDGSEEGITRPTSRTNFAPERSTPPNQRGQGGTLKRANSTGFPAKRRPSSPPPWHPHRDHENDTALGGAGSSDQPILGGKERRTWG